MLSKALDIREVFDQLSTAVAGILPHDRMVLGLLSKDRKNVHIHAYSGERLGQGRENAKAFLRENPDLFKKIEDRVRKELGLTRDTEVAAPV